MSFNPNNFYQLAQELHSRATHDDAALRSAISRSYYAALISVRNYLNITPPPRSNSHQFIINESRKNHPHIANYLTSLKRDRIKADYKTDEICSLEEGTKALDRCDRVLKSLQI